MRRVRLAGAAINTTPLDWSGNASAIREAIASARAAGASVLCLPEMCITGYGCEDAFSSTALQATARRVLRELLPDTRGMIVTLGLPVVVRNAMFNCSCVCADGRLLGLVAKRHLAGEGLHYEPRWFKAWPEGARLDADLDGEHVPIGDLHFDIGGLRIGFEICEDAWVAQRPGAALSRLGIDVILNPSASHFAFNKIVTRERFVIEGSRAFGAAYVYANLLGNESGRAIYDGGVLIASCGELLARGPRLTMDRVLLSVADIDVDVQRSSQVRTHSFEPDLGESHLEIRSTFRVPEAPTHPPTRSAPAVWETSPSAEFEEFTRAVSLGLFDYLRKSKSHGLVVSLSGGADSSGVVALVHTMISLACQSLGLDGFKRSLGYRTLKGASVKELMRELLTTCYQSSANSSEATRASARTLAAAVGAEHHELDVASIVSGYVGAIERALGRELTWKTDDFALQNIQARVRGPSVWLLANIKNALLLATSNRSEAAVGYATMDGDTCGGLSPLAGIDKAFLLRWLRWMQSTGPEGVGPLAALERVTKLTPTPELRPADMKQTSEGDLMPYDVLDAIEQLAITKKLAPSEVLESLSLAMPSVARGQLVAWIDKFFTLWCRNQWKRERYAPSFHVDDHNLDPKTWCRFPILSGGFAQELAELRGSDHASGKSVGGGA